MFKFPGSPGKRASSLLDGSVDSAQPQSWRRWRKGKRKGENFYVLASVPEKGRDEQVMWGTTKMKCDVEMNK